MVRKSVPSLRISSTVYINPISVYGSKDESVYGSKDEMMY